MQRNLIDHYRRSVLPLREQIVDLTLKNYNYMLVGAFDLLMAKQQEFEAYQKYIETLRDYWIVRADMQRSLGGRLPGHMDTRHNIGPDTAAENKMETQDVRANKMN
jgi:cobalt-zinc-cadmium efflux system outer membrane protein